MTRLILIFALALALLPLLACAGSGTPERRCRYDPTCRAPGYHREVPNAR